MNNPELRPKVGVGVMILKDGKALLGKRKSAHGSGEYAFPGGHLEYMETFEACAARETLEEAGIEIKNIRFLYAANIMLYKPKHYVHITMIADWAGGEPQTLEPEKCEGWGWYDIDQAPTPLFETCRVSFDSYKTGKNYYSF